MRHLWPTVLAVAVAVLFLSCWQGERYDAQVARADSLATVADTERAAALRFQRAADSIQARVDTVVRVQRVRDVRVDSVLVEVRGQPVPEGCEAIVADHRAALDSLETSRDTWRASYEGQKAATALLGVAYDTLEVAYTRVRTAYELLRNPPRRLQVAPAVFAGLCTDGRPCAGVGVTIRWGR